MSKCDNKVIARNNYHLDNSIRWIDPFIKWIIECQDDICYYHKIEEKEKKDLASLLDDFLNSMLIKPHRTYAQMCKHTFFEHRYSLFYDVMLNEKCPQHTPLQVMKWFHERKPLFSNEEFNKKMSISIVHNRLTFRILIEILEFIMLYKKHDIVYYKSF